VVFDGDKDKKEKDKDGKEIKEVKEVKRLTLTLLKNLGEPVDDKNINEIKKVKTEVKEKYAVFENDFEDTLKKELKDYDALVSCATENWGPCGKPLKHYGLAENLEKEQVPQTIINIINRIKELKRHTEGAFSRPTTISIPYNDNEMKCL
jgi:hypothetical protein